MLGQNWNDGGGAMPARGGERPSFRDILNPLTGLTAAQAKALPPDERFAGMRAVTVDGKRWTYNLTSALEYDHVNDKLFARVRTTGVESAVGNQSAIAYRLFVISR